MLGLGLGGRSQNGPQNSVNGVRRSPPQLSDPSVKHRTRLSAPHHQRPPACGQPNRYLLGIFTALRRTPGMDDARAKAANNG